MELNPKKYNHPLQKVKSVGFIQVGLQAKTNKFRPWSAVVIPRFCYWINTGSAWSPRLRAPHRKQLAGEAWVKQSPDPITQPCQSSILTIWGEQCWGGQCVTWGWTWRTCPGCLSVWSWLGRFGSSLLIFFWLTWDGLDKGVLLLQVTPGSLCCFRSSF